MSKKEKVKRSKKQKVLMTLVVIVSVIAFFFLVLMPIASVFVYNSVFGERGETAPGLMYSVEDFPGLNVEECTFYSYEGAKLQGYKYSKDTQDIKGLIIISHGLGAGHNTYMVVADYFTSNGYYVFAYDATGNDKSEGNSVRGLPQGASDLNSAIEYAYTIDEYKDLPIALFGHSWGAYSAGTVLNKHNELDAVVLIAGFDSSIEIFEQQGKSMVGPVIKIFMPYIKIYEYFKFKEFSLYTSNSGFFRTDAGIMIIHSRDDDTVYFENGYQKFYDEYADSERDSYKFTFIEFEDRGHTYIYNSLDSKEYRAKINSDYKAFVEANGGEYNSEIMNEYRTKNLDKSKAFELDSDLFKEILDFYDYWCVKKMDRLQ